MPKVVHSLKGLFFKKEDVEYSTKAKDKNRSLCTEIYRDHRGPLPEDVFVLYPVKLYLSAHKRRVIYFKSSTTRDKWIRMMTDKAGHRIIVTYYNLINEIGKGKYGQIFKGVSI